MSKVLVTYATKSGSVKELAERIGSKLADSADDVEVVQVGEAPDPSGYDAVVVGSGVRAGSWHGPAKDWVKANAGTLQAKPVAFFTVGLMITEEGKAEEVRAYTDSLIEESGVKPSAVGLFGGWNQPKEFGFAERLIMKAMKAPTGDFRDLEAAEKWAAEIAGKLGLEAGRGR